MFQPESGDAPVQVLGLLESVGLAFDALWVSGLTDDAWPQSPRPNPFLPVSLQRKAGIPQASAEASLSLDLRITQSWAGAANEVVFSHAVADEERALEASPLVAGFEAVDAAALGIPAYQGLREALFAAGRDPSAWTGCGDRVAPALGAEAARGGTAILADQSACPFRAFAGHRLGAEGLEKTEPGLGPAERGQLLHMVMARLWRSLGSHEALFAMAPAELEALITESARVRGAAAKGATGPPRGPIRRARAERLAQAARAWLEVDRSRPPFAVALQEEALTIEAGGLAFRGRIDRMDRLEGGASPSSTTRRGRRAWRAGSGSVPTSATPAVCARRRRRRHGRGLRLPQEGPARLCRAGPRGRAAAGRGDRGQAPHGRQAPCLVARTPRRVAAVHGEPRARVRGRRGGRRPEAAVRDLHALRPVRALPGARAPGDGGRRRGRRRRGGRGMSETPVADARLREEALDPRAPSSCRRPRARERPASSSSATCALLATVRRPEEILAITFTRKAAGEMERRVLDALHAARNRSRRRRARTKPHHELAAAALAHDAARGWRLLENTARLRVQTIDSFRLADAPDARARRLGCSPGWSTMRGDLFHEAAVRTLAMLDRNRRGADAIAHCSRISTATGQAVGLIAGMLARRDQWLRPRLERRRERGAIEAAFVLEREAHGGGARRSSRPRAAAWPRRHATGEMRRMGASPTSPAKASPRSPPGLGRMPAWQAWPPCSSRPRALAQVAPKAWDFRPTEAGAVENAHDGAARALDRRKWRTAAAVGDLPSSPRLDDRAMEGAPRWSPFCRARPPSCSSSSRTAGSGPRADRGRAVRALGDEPSRRICCSRSTTPRHLLVDEFQDTSRSQWALLRQLTSGWERDDGRTVFFVGDPMQSIYAFREADVGLFLRAQRGEGLLGTLTITPLRLARTFARAGIVDWVNTTFARVFPRRGRLPPARFLRSRRRRHGSRRDARGPRDPHPLDARRRPRGEDEAAAVAELVGRIQPNGGTPRSASWAAPARTWHRSSVP